MTQSSKETFLNCPFCPESKVGFDYDEMSTNSPHYVGCGRCGCSTGRFKTKIDACAAWNQRTQADAKAPVDVMKMAKEVAESIYYSDVEAVCGKQMIGPSPGVVQDAIAKIATALRSITTGQTVPEGWQLVPKESTVEMSLAGKHYMKGSADVLFERQKAIGCFNVMLAAAPPSPQGEGK